MSEVRFARKSLIKTIHKLMSTTLQNWLILIQSTHFMIALLCIIQSLNHRNWQKFRTWPFLYRNVVLHKNFILFYSTINQPLKSCQKDSYTGLLYLGKRLHLFRYLSFNAMSLKGKENLTRGSTVPLINYSIL